ncbi:N-acetylglucosamine-6-phosphate deacetylase [Rhodobacter sp. Har01]|uniref:N-acetylglucosamine-6-phosphate deacetylase n=1 Tax=Rhodobacter sp. Har01 TaxID=2883999 RepID=UPI001D0791D7|nr:N-acetylglucosamine-6-phosphate deacetylase [Rhodobacter sp. Har01]MCB6177918.1 N-acetylglucosamine-6-phosphate deacetylase [Rhodobacter sp. Har01]
MPTTYTGATVFDGTTLRPGASLTVDGDRITDSAGTETFSLQGGYLLPGLLDLQVNGAGGQMVSGRTTAQDLRAFCDTHARLGATGVLPTLITDTPEATASLIDAAVRAAGTPGLLGLHLEGPHLDPRRKGAHDAALIRPMTDEDLNSLCEGRTRLPALLVTVAPASVTPEQIATLTRAGIVVSLGHADCTHAEATRAFAAGATCVTHLFNAMSQLTNREPGLAGAAMTPGIHAGLIADGLHVHPAAMRIAMAANPDGLYLVSDAMAPAGSPITEFTLGGRRILRRNGRLTLEDGTLAGADLTLPQAIRTLVATTGTRLETAFAMASSRPAAILSRPDLGHLRPGAPADFIHLGRDFSLQGVWRAGARLL